MRKRRRARRNPAPVLVDFTNSSGGPPQLRAAWTALARETSSLGTWSTNTLEATAGTARWVAQAVSDPAGRVVVFLDLFKDRGRPQLLIARVVARKLAHAPDKVSKLSSALAAGDLGGWAWVHDRAMWQQGQPTWSEIEVHYMRGRQVASVMAEEEEFGPPRPRPAYDPDVAARARLLDLQNPRPKKPRKPTKAELAAIQAERAFEGRLRDIVIDEALRDVEQEQREREVEQMRESQRERKVEQRAALTPEDVARVLRETAQTKMAAFRYLDVGVGKGHYAPQLYSVWGGDPTPWVPTKIARPHEKPVEVEIDWSKVALPSFPEGDPSSYPGGAKAYQRERQRVADERQRIQQRVRADAQKLALEMARAQEKRRGTPYKEGPRLVDLRPSLSEEERVFRRYVAESQRALRAGQAFPTWKQWLKQMYGGLGYRPKWLQRAERLSNPRLPKQLRPVKLPKLTKAEMAAERASDQKFRDIVLDEALKSFEIEWQEQVEARRKARRQRRHVQRIDPRRAIWGWRGWRVVPPGLLESPQQRTQWPSKALHAAGWTKEGAVRGVAGIHASWSRKGDIMRERAIGRVRVPRGAQIVYGPEGFRAEEVVIDRLLVAPDVSEAERKHLAEMYGVPVGRLQRMPNPRNPRSVVALGSGGTWVATLAQGHPGCAVCDLRWVAC